MNTKTNSLEIVCPGKILKKYFMEPLEISGYKLAKGIGVPQITISNIVNKQKSAKKGLFCLMCHFDPHYPLLSVWPVVKKYSPPS
jgi:hypothetical protein